MSELMCLPKPGGISSAPSAWDARFEPKEKTEPQKSSAKMNKTEELCDCKKEDVDEKKMNKMNKTEESCDCKKEDVDGEKSTLTVNDVQNDISSANSHDDQGDKDPLSLDEDDMDIDTTITFSPKRMAKSEFRFAENLPQLTNGQECSELNNEKSPSGAEHHESQDQISDGSQSPARQNTPVLPSIAIRKTEDLMARDSFNLIQNRLQELYQKCKTPSAGMSPLASQRAFSSQRSNMSYKSEKCLISSQLPAHSGQQSANTTAKSPARQPSDPAANKVDDNIEESSDEDELDFHINTELDWSDGFDNHEAEEKEEPVGGTSFMATGEDKALSSELTSVHKQPRQKISDYFMKTSKKESETNPTADGVNSAVITQKMMKSEVGSDNTNSGQLDGSTYMIRDADIRDESIGTRNGQNSVEKFRESDAMFEINSELNRARGPSTQRKFLQDQMTSNHTQNKSTISQQPEKMLKPILTEGGRMNHRGVYQPGSGQHGFDGHGRSGTIEIHSSIQKRPGTNSKMLRPILTDAGAQVRISPQRQNIAVPKQQLLRETAPHNPGQHFASSDEDQSTKNLIPSKTDGQASRVETPMPIKMTSHSNEQWPQRISTDPGIHLSQSQPNSKLGVTKQRRSAKKMANVQYLGIGQSESTSVENDTIKPCLADQSSGFEHQQREQLITNTGIYSSHSGQSSKHNVTQQRKSPKKMASCPDKGINNNVPKSEVLDQGLKQRKAAGSSGHSQTHGPIVTDQNPHIRTTMNKVVTQKRPKATVNDLKPDLKPSGENFNVQTSNGAHKMPSVPHKTAGQKSAAESCGTFDSDDSSPEAPKANKKQPLTRKSKNNQQETKNVGEKLEAEFSSSISQKTGGQNQAAKNRGAFDSDDSSLEAPKSNKKRATFTKKTEKSNSESETVEENFRSQFFDNASMQNIPCQTGGQKPAAGTFESEDSSPEGSNAEQKRAGLTRRIEKNIPESEAVEENFDGYSYNNAPKMRNVPCRAGGMKSATNDRKTCDSEDNSPEASNGNMKRPAGSTGHNKYADSNSHESENVKFKNSQRFEDSGSQLRRSNRLISKDTTLNFKESGSGAPTSPEESDWDPEGSDSDFPSSDLEKPNRKLKTMKAKGQGLMPSSQIVPQIPASLKNLGVQVQWSRTVPKNDGQHPKLLAGTKKMEHSNESEPASQKQAQLHQDVPSQREADALVKHLPGIKIQRSKPAHNGVQNNPSHQALIGSNNSQEKVTGSKSAPSTKASHASQHTPTHQERSNELTSRKDALAASIRHLPGIQFKQVQKTDQHRRSPTPELSESDLQIGDFSELETVQKSLESDEVPMQQQQLQTDRNVSPLLQNHIDRCDNPSLPSQNHSVQGDYASDDSQSQPEQYESDWDSSEEESRPGAGEIGDITTEPKPESAKSNGMKESSAAQHLPELNQADIQNNIPQFTDNQRDVSKSDCTDAGAGSNLRSNFSNEPTLPFDDSENTFSSGRNLYENGSYDSLDKPDLSDSHSYQDTSVLSNVSSGKSIPAKRPQSSRVKSTKNNTTPRGNTKESDLHSVEYNAAFGSQQNDTSRGNKSRPKKSLPKKGSKKGGNISPINNPVHTSSTPRLPAFQESFPSVPSAHLGRSCQDMTEELSSMYQEVHTFQENIPLPPMPTAAAALKKTNLLACDTDSNDSFNVLRRRKEDEPHNVIPESDDSSSFHIAEVFPTMCEDNPPRPLAPVAVASGGSIEVTPVEFESGEKTYLNLDAHQIPKFPKKSKSKSSRNPKSAQGDLSNGDFQGSQRNMFQCVLCPQRFGSAEELQAHAAAEGHIVCSLSASCAGLRFDTAASLAQHQSQIHQQFNHQTPASQRVTAQVDKLPQASEGYPTLPEISYGSPSNFNCPKLGSQRFDAPPPPALPVPNLPSGIQLTKRAAPATEAVHVPPKISRGDNGMPRLPGGITLVKSPRAPPPKNNMVDLLANRGVSMVSKTVSPAAQRNLNQSVSIQPVSPATRLPNLPPGISISSSRPQSSSYSNVQGFAVPPTPPRGRQVTNMETVDLTRNNANRMQGGRPPMAPPMGAGNRSATCTICDKVFPSPELLKNHMTVHGGQVSRGRFMCEICRVIYPNEAKLAHHKRTVHAKPASAEATGPEFVIPICDISQNGVKQKLLQCGIRHIVQMSSLRNANDTATFGLPIIPIDLARNEAFSRLDDLGASNILSLGTLKTITH